MAGWIVFASFVISGAIYLGCHEIAQAIKGLPGWQEMPEDEDQ